MSEEYHDMPQLMRWTMIFVDRVGFPVLAFLLMFYLCYQTINKNTQALVDLKYTEDDHSKNVLALIQALKEDIRAR